MAISILTLLLLLWFEHFQPLYRQRQVRKRLRKNTVIVTAGGIVARVIGLRGKTAIIQTDDMTFTIAIEFIDRIYEE